MSELWWAEAVIQQDREPDWAAAHSYLDRLTAEQIHRACPNYVKDIPNSTLTAAGLFRHDEYEYEDEDILKYPELVELIKPLLHRDLQEISEMMRAPRHHVCRFSVSGLKIYVYCCGYSSEGPDRLCDAWLRLDNLCAFHHAGFLTTGA